MSRKYSDIAFTGSVKKVQRAQGSRDLYARHETIDEHCVRLGRVEVDFVAARDGFYVATVSETGWPYVQFRGGPPGFLRVLGEDKLGFADFRGNRQYVTTGNVAIDDRVSLFLMDYPSRRRLKMFGRMRGIERSADPELVGRLAPAGYRAEIERAFLIRVEAFDWNCPQHITPRFTTDEIARDPGIRGRICAEAPKMSGSCESHSRAPTSEPTG